MCLVDDVVDVVQCQRGDVEELHEVTLVVDDVLASGVAIGDDLLDVVAVGLQDLTELVEHVFELLPVVPLPKSSSARIWLSWRTVVAELAQRGVVGRRPPRTAS